MTKIESSRGKFTLVAFLKFFLHSLFSWCCSEYLLGKIQDYTGCICEELDQDRDDEDDDGEDDGEDDDEDDGGFEVQKHGVCLMRLCPSENTL